ncbi:MAG: HGGxSTG domain-containing protein [Dongiaceae bacterium]
MTTLLHENPAAGPHGTASLPPNRRGRLNNGNPPGDFLAAPRCGARTRLGHGCRGPAMRNGRCRMHGGASTGPRTPAGLARSRRAGWKHGARSAEMAALRGAARSCLRRLDRLVAAAKCASAPAGNPAAHGVGRRFFAPLAGRRPATKAIAYGRGRAVLAAFDKLRLRGNLRGTKNSPLAEPVEARTMPIQASSHRERAVLCNCPDPATPPVDGRAWPGQKAHLPASHTSRCKRSNPCPPTPSPPTASPPRNTRASCASSGATRT